IQVRNLKLGVEQGAVDVERQQADGRRDHDRFYHPQSGFPRRSITKPRHRYRMLYCSTRMGIFSALLNPYGFLLVALAIIHFIRRRPDTYWLYIILFLGPLGATVYLLVEALPDVGLLRQSFKVFPRRKRIRELEAAVLDNPSAGNYEELADLYMEEGNFDKARACFDNSISSRPESLAPFHGRAVGETELGDFVAAVPDLERVIKKVPEYAFRRAKGLLAHAYANTGLPAKADEAFQETTKISTLSETYYNYATF